MPTVWPPSSVVRVHRHSDRFAGSSPGQVMGKGGGVNDTSEEKLAYYQMGTPT